MNIQLDFLTLQYADQIAIDGHLNVAHLRVPGFGPGLGGKVSGGVSVAASNADNVDELSGWFNNQSVGGGLGPYGSVDVFEGRTETGKAILGGGGTIGIGVGAGATDTVTNTFVTPIGRFK